MQLTTLFLVNNSSIGIIKKVLPSLLEGTKLTLSLFFLTLIISLPVGIIISLGFKSRLIILRKIISIYTWIIRGTPLLLQMFFIFFGLPLYTDIVFDRFQAVLLAFVINYAAYFAEIFRGGIQSINVGQYEAAQVLGLSKSQTTFKIIIPQVFKIVLPSIGNEVITLVKDTSLVYALGLSDVMRAGKIALSREVSIVPLVVVAVIYLILTGIVTIILQIIEKKVNFYR